MKTIALFLTLLIPTLALAEVEPLSTPSPNTGTITPTAIVAETGSFSGSVTASSVTALTGAKIYGTAGSPSQSLGNQILNLEGSSTARLHVGFDSGNAFGTWFQSNGSYPILLNPMAGSVGIGTASPCSTCTLHVAGGASVTGAFAVASATFTVATTGIVSAPSQPWVYAPMAGSLLTNGVETQVFYTAPAAGDDTASMWGGAASSGTFTVPTGGAGKYHIEFVARLQALASVSVIIKVNGSAVRTIQRYEGSGNTYNHDFNGIIKLAAGDVVTTWINQNAGSDKSNLNEAGKTYFTALKVW